MRSHTGAVSWTVYQAQEGRGISLPERSEILVLSDDAPFKKQNPQSVHTQREEATRKALKTAEETLTPPQRYDL